MLSLCSFFLCFPLFKGSGAGGWVTLREQWLAYRNSRSAPHPALLQKKDGGGHKAPRNPIFLCLTVVVFLLLVPRCKKTTSFTAVHLMLLCFSTLHVNCTKIKSLLMTDLPMGLEDSILLYLYCRKDLQQDIYSKSVCRRIL